MKKLIVLLFSIVTTSAAAGGIDSIWQQMLSASSHAQGVSTNTRNGVVLGSASIRVKTVQDQILSVRAPYLQASCKGIDFFGGSLSILKKDELIQMARSLVASAPMYAFQLAFDMLCPDCNAIMADLADRLNNLNQYVTGDCEKLSSMIDSTWGRDDFVKQHQNHYFDTYNKKADAFFDGVADAMPWAGSSEKDTKAKLGSDFTNKVQGNSVVETVASSTQTLPLISSDKRTVGEFMMNVLGTFATEIDDSVTANATDGGNTVFNNYVPKFDIQYFYNPSPDLINASQKQLKCTKTVSEDPDCVYVNEVDVAPTDSKYIHSYMEQIGNEMCGYYDSSKRDASIMNKIFTKQKLSDNQTYILGLVPTNIRKLIIEGPGANATQLQNCQIASKVAAIYATKEMYSGITKIANELKNSKKGQDKSFADLDGRLHHLAAQTASLDTDLQEQIRAIQLDVNIASFIDNGK